MPGGGYFPGAELRRELREDEAQLLLGFDAAAGILASHGLLCSCKGATGAADSLGEGTVRDASSLARIVLGEAEPEACREQSPVVGAQGHRERDLDVIAPARAREGVL